MGRLLRWAGTCCLLPIVCVSKPKLAGDFIFFIRMALRPAQRGFRMRTDLWKGKLCFTAFVTGPQGSVCRRTHNYDITQITWRLLWGHRFIAYCWNFLSPKFTLQSSGSMKSRRANLLHFLLFAKNICPYMFFFLFWECGNKTDS